jgi:CRISPR-associated endonuclease/helicase Cas3
MEQYYAHIAEDGRTQTVAAHLEGTADLCEKFAKSFGAGEQGRMTGFAHDIGKCSAAFQERLRGGVIVDHATAGAWECMKRGAEWAAFCVAGHHGGLPDGGSRTDDSDSTTLLGRLYKAKDGRIPTYEMPFALPVVSDPIGYRRSPLSDSFFIRMLYSCLVDADYLDTEQFVSGDLTSRTIGQPMSTLLNRLEKYTARWQNPSSDLNRRRCEILQACQRGADHNRGLFSLTVPTGGGKTVASIAFALRHAVRNQMDRVIYVIPYTSIIEQTAEVFRGIFGAENVLEHHSNAAYEVNEVGDTLQYNLARATENWDAPIVVTTAVQFFESLYANKPSKCRKLHNIANSVIVFDEAQMLPTQHLRPCVAAIAKLVTDFRATAVLCTATQPVLNDLFQRYAPDRPIVELCPDAKELSTQLRRVQFTQIGKVNAEDISQKLAALPQVLCIVNSRDAAQEVFRKLPEEGRFHLSTLMYPAHRRATLSDIRNRLAAGQPCRVVATSLIEAGVDVDFPAVFRELAGVDSILQAAGRCNREGKRCAEDSIVTVFEGVSVTPQLLQLNIGAAREALSGGADPADFDTVRRYFASYRSLMQRSMLDKANLIGLFETGTMPFRTAAERFHLIDSAAKTIYVPLEDGAALVHRLQSGERSRALFRQLGRYSVNVYDRQFDELMIAGYLEIVDDDSAVLTDVSRYDPKTGLNVSENTITQKFLCI